MIINGKQNTNAKQALLKKQIAKQQKIKHKMLAIKNLATMKVVYSNN